MTEYKPNTTKFKPKTYVILNNKSAICDERDEIIFHSKYEDAETWLKNKVKNSNHGTYKGPFYIVYLGLIGGFEVEHKEVSEMVPVVTIKEKEELVGEHTWGNSEGTRRTKTYKITKEPVRELYRKITTKKVLTPITD